MTHSRPRIVIYILSSLFALEYVCCKLLVSHGLRYITYCLIYERQLEPSSHFTAPGKIQNSYFHFRIIQQCGKQFLQISQHRYSNTVTRKLSSNRTATVSMAVYPSLGKPHKSTYLPSQYFLQARPDTFISI